MTAEASPAVLAGQAAESVRLLNHATLPSAGGLVFPADAHEVAGQLALLASRLPQALAQLLAFLQAEVQAGRVAVVAGEHARDPAAALAAVAGSLDAAVASARQLHQALDAAQKPAHLGRRPRRVALAASGPGRRPDRRQIMPGKITVQGDRRESHVTGAAGAALERDLSRRQDARAGRTAPALACAVAAGVRIGGLLPRPGTGQARPRQPPAAVRPPARRRRAGLPSRGQAVPPA